MHHPGSMYFPHQFAEPERCRALVLFVVMAMISAPRGKEQLVLPRKSSLWCNLFKAVAPLPRVACNLFLLSVKCTMTMLVATIRMVVPPWRKSLLGETVVITGAGHGIGKELAIQLATLGCITICWDSDLEANRDTLRAISEEGGEGHGFAVDVSKRLEVRETVRLMRKANIPDVSILINNAGVLIPRPFLEYQDDDIHKIFDLNVLSQFWTIQTFLPTMLVNKKGHIVSICSTYEFDGIVNKVPYSSSNFAVTGLMEGLFEELRLTKKNSNINLTTIYPLCVDTGFDGDPKYKLPSIFGAVSAKYAAAEIIKAIQRNYEEYSIPRCILYWNAINRILPRKAVRLISDFLSFSGNAVNTVAG